MEQPEGEKKKDLDVFVSELLSEKGLEDSAEAHAKLLERVRAEIHTAILGTLPLKDLDMLEYYTRDNKFTRESLDKMLAAADFDINATVDYAMSEFKKIYLEAK